MKRAAPLLLGLLLQCASLPAREGCAPRATRCSPTGRPQVCSATERWTNVSEVACSTVGAVCCLARDPWGQVGHACVAPTACLEQEALACFEDGATECLADGGVR